MFIGVGNNGVGKGRCTHFICPVTLRYIRMIPARPIKSHSVSPHLPVSLDSVRPVQTRIAQSIRIQSNLSTSISLALSDVTKGGGGTLWRYSIDRKMSSV